MAKMMRAVTFRGSGRVAVEQHPIPRIIDPKDVVVKVRYAAICGSDLHAYRGKEACEEGTILGHEFCGRIVEVGENVKAFKPGDFVVSPFTVSCGECFFCTSGLSSRCQTSRLYGSSQLPGAQAEYVRVPLADATAVKAPPSLRPTLSLLLADIFPTGYYAVSSAMAMLPAPIRPPDATVVVVGCGPVGLCAVVAATTYTPGKLFAVDSVADRLQMAGKLGAHPTDLTAGGAERVLREVREATGRRGADVVVELVGLKPALRLAFDVLRPGGVLVSVGVHAHGECPWDLNEAYDKNLRAQFGRCPVRSIFTEALKVLEAKQDVFGFMEENVLPLTSAPEGFEAFDRRDVYKVILDVSR